MQVARISAALFAAIAVTACSDITAPRDVAMKKATVCAQDVAESPETAVIYQRLWLGDGSDTINKLRDPDLLTPEQKNAFNEFHDEMLHCRQMIVSAGSQSDTRKTIYRQELFQRGDAIYFKLVRDEIPVGLANKLTIESNAKYQAALLKDDPRAIHPEELQRQRDAETILAESEKMAAAQPPPVRARGKQKQSMESEQAQSLAATTCTWSGNTLDCTRPR